MSGRSLVSITSLTSPLHMHAHTRTHHLQILLHDSAQLDFVDNFATALGAGLYVETTSTDFILVVLNTGCFIRYNSSLVDIPPSKWVC